MHKWIFNLIGITLILGAIFGLILCISGLAVVWLGKPAIYHRISNDLDLLNRTLNSTETLLQTIDSSLKQVEDDRLILESAIEDLTAVVKDITPTIDTIANLIGEDYLNLVKNTHDSLASIQSSAQAIDNTLNLISSIPIFGAYYAPDIPIQTTIGYMMQALEPLPPKLIEIQDSLKNNEKNIKNLSTNLEQLSQNIIELGDNLTQARQTIQEYQTIIDEAKKEVEDWQENIGLWLNVVASIVTIFILWMFVVQITIFTQGMEIYNQNNRFYRHPLDPT